MNNLALNNHLLTNGYRSDICDIQRPTHTRKHPEPGLGDWGQGGGGAEVEYGRCAAAMQVAEAVAVRGLYGEGEDGAARGLGGGDELDGVAEEGGGPALGCVRSVSGMNMRG